MDKQEPVYGLCVTSCGTQLHEPPEAKVETEIGQAFQIVAGKLSV